jgi:hypothetical protein
LETFLLLAKDAENNLRPPHLPKTCHHGVPPLQCSESDPDTRYRCPSGDDIKYRMTRLAVDAVDLFLLENGTAVQIWVCLILLICNCKNTIMGYKKNGTVLFWFMSLMW